MRDGSLEDGFGNVLDTFEALVENLDHLIAFHTGDGSPPEVVSHIENAKALASRGVALAHRQVGLQRLQQFGSQPTYVKMRQRRM